MPLTNNSTVERIEIKHRADGTYTIYINKAWAATVGNYIAVLDVLQDYFEREE